MMGQLNQDQGQLFYSFNLEEAVPKDHQVRGIAAVLDLSWLRHELTAYYSNTGRPSIDPALIMRMLILGYAFGIRSERALCREVQVNLAYRWFCGLGLEDKVPDHSAFTWHAMSGSETVTFSAACLSASSAHASKPGLLAVKGSPLMPV